MPNLFDTVPAGTAPEALLNYTRTALVLALVAVTSGYGSGDARAQGAHLGDGDVPVRHDCATGSEAVLEASRMAIHTPEMFGGGGHPHERPPQLRASVSQRGNIALIVDDDEEIIPRGMNWNDPQAVGETNWEMQQAFYQGFADDYDFLIFFTERNLDIGAYYSPRINDVTGIGYQHFTPEETFDSFDGRLRMQGIILMNNYRGFLGPQGMDIGRMTFNQELGHRWAARVHAIIAGRDSNETLGRDLSHWSYFMHSANSSMEGNTWLDRGRGEFVTRTRIDSFSFSNLDRYLMGLVSPAEADDEALFIIRDPLVGSQRDLTGNRINRSSPPQFGGGDKLVGGERYDLSIDDVVAAEGAREPSHLNSVKEFRAAFVLVMRPAHGLDDDDFDDFDAMRRRMAADFMEDAGNGMVLHTYLGSRVGLGEVCRFGIDCDPDLGGQCERPTEDADKLCLPECDVEQGCPQGWCCGGDVGLVEDLCVPPELCPEPAGEEGGDEAGEEVDGAGEAEEGGDDGDAEAGDEAGGAVGGELGALGEGEGEAAGDGGQVDLGESGAPAEGEGAGDVGSGGDVDPNPGGAGAGGGADGGVSRGGGRGGGGCSATPADGGLFVPWGVRR